MCCLLSKPKVSMTSAAPDCRTGQSKGRYHDESVQSQSLSLCYQFIYKDAPHLENR